MFKPLLFSVFIALVLGAPPPNSKLSRKSNYKIDEASPANIADFPWHVYIEVSSEMFGREYKFECEGFLVTPSWIVTSAYTIDGIDTSIPPDGDGVLSIRVGSNFTDRGGAVYRMSKYVVHPGFNWTYFNNNNIGLIKLSTPVNTPFARPGPLPAAGESIPDNASFIVTGYNETEYNETELLQATMPTFDYDTCKALYKDVYGVDDNIGNSFCGDKNGTKNCFGLSGSPVHLDGKIVGIRIEDGCGPFGLPSVVTKVSQYIDWINEIVQE